ncbi:DUF1552 domain-containing protein [Lignipirellula cremea]|uniref:DUF1552 domain-containing protein n=1 Tax=Lignipirellula cremea TaxID=2528010 RepID=A0A518DNK2_9BACT|nr:DUF1552 domain-containing protein [Lignipirellula cremea]QDU93418.1 hypothetical protein Pla8534_11980 [Lignipirellula cremea]
MKSTTPLSRRTVLRGIGGAVLGLPLLEAMAPVVRAAGAPPATTPRRLIAMNFGLGLYGKAFFPEQAGKDYQPSPYLERLADHRDDFTVVSGLCHPGISGGHASESSIFTSTPNDTGKAFRNGVSLDELIAEKLGDQTRYASLRMAHQHVNLSWNRQGAPLPYDGDITQVYDRLFGIENPADRALQRKRLRSGRSILDVVGDSAKRLEKNLSRLDQHKLDEYYSSVRDVEVRLAKDESWFDRPKPQVDMKPPTKDQVRGLNSFERMRMFFDLAFLAIQTDSTRCIAYAAPTTATITIPGENITNSYHNLTHHGMDPENIRQMMLIECVFMDELGKLLTRLKETQEDGDRLLDRTSVLVTSNLGNGAGHGCKNLPVLLAGGGFQHGQHLEFNPPNQTPLANLYVSLLQRLGIEEEQFGTSTNTLTGLVAR